MKTKLFLFCFFTTVFSAAAQIILPKIFTDNMVLQREAPILFWGKAAPDSELTVRFSSEEIKFKTKADSTWQVEFSPKEASANPQTIQITAENDSITLTNILIGDVWLLTGQSNMEFPLRSEMHFEEEKEHLAGDQLRFFNADFAGKWIYNEKYSEENLKKLTTDQFYSGKWEQSGLPQLEELSVVGYYFGKEILQEEKIPIGLINLSIGGAPLEAFLSVETLKEDPQFRTKAKTNWLQNDALPKWIRERGEQNVGGIAIHFDGLGPNHAYKPGFAYTAGIEPILKMSIKGILWYQGESNAQEMARVEEYAALQKLMITDYRRKWKQPDLPFYWVQLSSIDTINYKGNLWPEFRNEQRLLLDEVDHVGMAVTSDIGARNDVHPTNKKDVGQRLARWALKQDYGTDVLVSGPLPKDVNYVNGKVTISFNYVGKGLRTKDGNKLQGFSLDGKNPIPANIIGNTIVIQVPQKPEAVYYGWQAYSPGNLVNSEGLPASTFKLKL